MNKKKETILLSNGDMILSKLGILTFLAIFLLGLGAGVELWTASYRAFFVWLAFSLLAGAARIALKYSGFQRREQDLLRNIERGKRELQVKEEEKRRRAEQLDSLLSNVERMKDEKQQETAA